MPVCLYSISKEKLSDDLKIRYKRWMTVNCSYKQNTKCIFKKKSSIWWDKMPIIEMCTYFKLYFSKQQKKKTSSRI